MALIATKTDPYLYKRLTLGVSFEYMGQTFDSGGYKQVSNEFMQRYNLMTSGNIVDPRLFTYDASISFSDTIYKVGTAESKREIDNYFFTSSIMRNTRIPLHLYATRNVTNNTAVSSSNEEIVDRYGAQWSLFLPKMPLINLSFNKTVTEKDEVVDYEIDLDKIIGPTINNLNYSVTTSKGESFDNDTGATVQKEVETSVLRFTNDAKLPMNSKLSVGLTQNIIDSTTKSDNSETIASSINLYTEQMTGFRQQYQYTFSRNEQSFYNTTSENGFFNGAIYYQPTNKTFISTALHSSQNESISPTSESTTINNRFSTRIDHIATERLNLLSSLDASQSKTESPTSDSDQKTGTFSSSANYRLSRDWSTNEGLTYTYITDDQITGLAERTILSANGSLGYDKWLKWASFTARGLLGYHKETNVTHQEETIITNEEGDTSLSGGEGIEYGLGTNLTGINTKFFSLSTGYNYSAIESYSGNVDNKAHSFNSNVGTSLTRYLPLSISYDYNKNDSYLDTEDKESDSISVIASMLYFTTIPITAYYSYYMQRSTSNPPPNRNYAWITEYKDESFSLATGRTFFKNINISVYTNFNKHEEGILDVGSSQVRTEKFSRHDTGILGGAMFAKDISVPFLGGRLDLAAGYNRSVSKTTTHHGDDINMFARLKYFKGISRNLRWGLKAQWSDNESTQGLHSTTITSGTELTYRLRAWSLIAGYQYTKRDFKEDEPSIEQRWTMALSRNFSMTWW